MCLSAPVVSPVVSTFAVACACYASRRNKRFTKGMEGMQSLFRDAHTIFASTFSTDSTEFYLFANDKITFSPNHVHYHVRIQTITSPSCRWCHFGIPERSPKPKQHRVVN